MPKSIPHDWLYPPSLTAATKIQKQLAEQICLVDDFKETGLIAGMDVSNNRFDPQNMIHAAAVTLTRKSLIIAETCCTSIQQKFPYIPGFLGFRESPVLVTAYQQLKAKPDIILVDGHGISHPRRFGIASHIGVLLDCPTIGVAKTILVGEPQTSLANIPGSTTPLIWHDQPIAMLLRSKKNALPLIISVGHRISLESAVAIVKQCLTKYRLPEPTRQAHLAANVCRREFDGKKV